MFTGIVEEVGRITHLPPRGHAGSLVIEAHTVLEDAKIGDSIAVNGVCLTVTTRQAGRFSADVMPQTLAMSALGHLRPGSAVNLERALPATGRFGGHIVSGHIDGVGTVARITRDQNAVRIHVQAPEHILQLIVPQGSIAVNGVSLTVARVTGSGFEVSIIPHSAGATTLGHLRLGSVVNLENDVIGKYVQRLMHDDGANDTAPASHDAGGITPAFLIAHGF